MSSSESFFRAMLDDLSGFELSLLRLGEARSYIPSFEGDSSSPLWFSFRAALAESRLLEAIPILTALTESPPLYSERIKKMTWPEVRGNVIWSAYTRGLASRGPLTKIPYMARHMSPSGPEIRVIVKASYNDVAVLENFLLLGFKGPRTAPFARAAKLGSAILSVPPVSGIVASLRNVSNDSQGDLLAALERLERGRAWSPASPALYEWIKKWLVEDGKAIRELLLSGGEDLEDVLYELWCAHYLAKAIARRLRSSEVQVSPIYERYLPSYGQHGEIFTIRSLTLPDACQIRIHFQRSKGVLDQSPNNPGKQRHYAWKRLQSRSGETSVSPSQLRPDLVISLGYKNNSGALVLVAPPIIADPKNRESAGSDERVKILGYLQAFAPLFSDNRASAGFLFVRDQESKKLPKLYVNRVLRSVKAVYEVPVEPGSNSCDKAFDFVAARILRRFKVRS